MGDEFLNRLKRIGRLGSGYMGGLLGFMRRRVRAESDPGVCPGRGEEQNPDQSIFNRAMQMPGNQKGQGEAGAKTRE